MPTGIAKDWTLEELQTIWNFDSSQSDKTVRQVAAEMGISRQSWYSLVNRIKNVGSPEAMYEIMQDSKTRRNNQGRHVKQSSTLAEQLRQKYAIRVSASGRDSTQSQYTVTIPPGLAGPFIEEFGREFRWVAVDEGLLIKPLPRISDKLPAWLNGASSDESP